MSELSDLTIEVSNRDQTGRQANKKLRASGRIPIVLYGRDTNKSLSLNDRSLRTLIRKASGTTSLMRLLGDKGEDELVLIKDIQMDPIKNSILHIDFIQVNRGEELQTKVPLKIIGEADGVKSQGGILEVLVNEIEIRCRPSNLPSQIEIDISELGLGENYQVKNLPDLEGISFTADLESVLVSCVGSAGGRSDAGEQSDDSDETSDVDEVPDENEGSSNTENDSE